jgi:hypothetical protein
MRGGVFLQAFVCVGIYIVASTQAFACSYSKPPSTEVIFRDASYVFRGIATKAETVGPDNIGIKVWWKVEENFKGHGLENNSTLTNSVCAGAIIVVGQPYVVTVERIEKSDVDDMDDVSGWLVDSGTKGAWFDKQAYEQLVQEFRNLSKSK